MLIRFSLTQYIQNIISFNMQSVRKLLKYLHCFLKSSMNFILIATSQIGRLSGSYMLLVSLNYLELLEDLKF